MIISAAVDGFVVGGGGGGAAVVSVVGGWSPIRDSHRPPYFMFTSAEGGNGEATGYGGDPSRTQCSWEPLGLQGLRRICRGPAVWGIP